MNSRYYDINLSKKDYARNANRVIDIDRLHTQTDGKIEWY